MWLKHLMLTLNPITLKTAKQVSSLTPQTLSTQSYAAKSLQSCLTLCDPIDGSPPGFPVPGILQARTLEWVAISFSNALKWKVTVKSLSRVQLLVIPWTAAHQAPPSMEFSRQEYWTKRTLFPCGSGVKGLTLTWLPFQRKWNRGPVGVEREGVCPMIESLWHLIAYYLIALLVSTKWSTAKLLANSSFKEIISEFSLPGLSNSFQDAQRH